MAESIYRKSSLAMIPYGSLEGELPSIRPQDGSGDFTFSRGTDTATRVNSSGLIEKERSNQLLQSNTFSTTWTTNNASVTSGQSGYDGSSDAWLLTATSTSNCRVNQTIGGSGVQSISVYAKANTSNFLAINAIVSGTNTIAYFDLSSGAVGTTGGAPIDADIESVGGGWYRCSLVYNDINTQMRLLITDADGSGAVTNGNSIYIQDAQLEQGLVATDYIETTTSAVYEGITDNLPRLDYSGGASCPSLLLEPQRRNLIDQSEYFGAWTIASGITLTHNHAISPEGVQNATLLARTTSGNIQQSKSVTSGTTYAISVFAKAGTSSIVNVIATGTLTESVTEFDLSDQSITTTTGSVVDSDIEDYGNGWYRCWVIQTAASTGSGQVRINTGDNVNILLYGAQLEDDGAGGDANYISSYIPTYGTSASRSEDSCSKTSATDLIGQSEGTILFDWNYLSNDGDFDFRFNLSDGAGTTEWMFVGMTNADARAYITSGGSLQFDSEDEYAITIGNRYKMALAYANNDFAFYINGTQVATSSSGSVPTGMDYVMMSNRPNSSGSLVKASVNQALLFKTRLTNAELAALTTL